MENIQQKADFLRYTFTKELAKLDDNAPRKWGKMTVQQMIEHFSDSMRNASGRLHLAQMTPEENIAKMQAFLESEKPFKENTPNPHMPDTPEPVKHATKQEAIDHLQNEIDHFFTAYEKEAGKKVLNPFFGTLSYEQQVQLLYKHAMHHLRQFGAVE